MKRNLLWMWILSGLMFIGLLAVTSISLAAGDKWTKKADMPTARGDLSTSSLNGKIYAIGGSKISLSTPLSIVEEYDTGFAGEEGRSIEAPGKLVTSWGKIKSSY